MSDDSNALLYFRRQHCQSQWRALLSAMFEKLTVAVPNAELQEFLHQIGTNMALEMPLGAQETLTALQSAINHRFAELDWGFAEFELEGQYVLIRHHQCPVPFHLGRPHEPSAHCLALVLEAMYSSWLLAQGGESGVLARQISTGEPMVFRYGASDDS